MSPEHIVIACDKLHYKRSKEVARGVSKSVVKVSKRLSKTPSEVDKILLETALIDLIQSLIEYCNGSGAFTSFKARLELEDCG